MAALAMLKRAVSGKAVGNPVGNPVDSAWNLL
jgi:hypothetical protein